MGTASKKTTIKEKVREMMTSLGSGCVYSDVEVRTKEAPVVAAGGGFSQEVTFKLRAD